MTQKKQTWKTIINDEKSKPYYKGITHFLEQERATGKAIYPKQQDVFNAFEHTPYDQIKVVIIGQDPYHNPGQAHGFSFSVPKGVKIPPSLNNIFKALHNDCGIEKPAHGCLINWAEQGILLLNTILTVEENKPQSHANIGWQEFTDAIIRSLNNHTNPIVFLLWGANAQKKQRLIDTDKHIIFTAPHPSPLSAHRGFLDCKHFSKTNESLKATGRVPIDWRL